VIDSKIGYTGGQNISDTHLGAREENPKRSLDLHFRFTGKIVDEFERAFLKDWHYCCGNTRSIDHAPANSNLAGSEHWTRLILDGPNENLDRLNELLVGVFSTATKRIWIMTPYFLPGYELVGALIGARLRGIDVRIVLPARTNIHLAHWAAQHNLQHILFKRLNVYLQPEPFVHTKALIIDDNYSLVGSANMDPRSLRLNFELGVEVFSEKFNHSLHEYFERRLALCSQLNEGQLQARPYWMKLRDAIAWLFSPYL